MNSVDVAQAPIQLDGEKSPKVRIDDPRTVCDGKAYEIKLVVQGIYEWKDVGVARKLLGNWYVMVQAMQKKTERVLEPMGRTARMIEEI